LPIVSLLLQNNNNHPDEALVVLLLIVALWFVGCWCGIVFAGDGVLLLLRLHADDSVGRFISCAVF